MTGDCSSLQSAHICSELLRRKIETFNFLDIHQSRALCHCHDSTIREDDSCNIFIVTIVATSPVSRQHTAAPGGSAAGRRKWSPQADGGHYNIITWPRLRRWSPATILVTAGEERRMTNDGGGQVQCPLAAAAVSRHTVHSPQELFNPTPDTSPAPDKPGGVREVSGPFPHLSLPLQIGIKTRQFQFANYFHFIT